MWALNWRQTYYSNRHRIKGTFHLHTRSLLSMVGKLTPTKVSFTWKYSVQFCHTIIDHIAIGYVRQFLKQVMLLWNLDLEYSGKECSILCLFWRMSVTMTSARIPEGDAHHHAHNMCVFSSIQKRIPGLMHKCCILQRYHLGLSMTSWSFSGWDKV